MVVGLLDQPRHRWWDDASTLDRVETRDDILLAAMTQARREITSLMARDVDEWRWGRLHTVTLRNQTLGESGIKPIEALFNRGAYEVDGGSAVVNAMAYDDKLGYTVVSGPTMRMLVDLGDLDQSRWVNQSGVSGHAFHRNYDDQTGCGSTTGCGPSCPAGPRWTPAPPPGSNWCPAADRAVKPVESASRGRYSGRTGSDPAITGEPPEERGSSLTLH